MLFIATALYEKKHAPKNLKFLFSFILHDFCGNVNNAKRSLPRELFSFVIFFKSEAHVHRESSRMPVANSVDGEGDRGNVMD